MTKEKKHFYDVDKDCSRAANYESAQCAYKNNRSHRKLRAASISPGGFLVQHAVEYNPLKVVKVNIRQTTGWPSTELQPTYAESLQMNQCALTSLIYLLKQKSKIGCKLNNASWPILD